MSDAGAAVRDALVARLRARLELAAIDGYDGEGRALPRITVDPPELRDWSTKDRRGREVRTAVRLRVARGQALRLPSMTGAVEAAGAALGGDLSGWGVASAVLLRTRVTDQPDGTRVALVEHRVRVLEN